MDVAKTAKGAVKSKTNWLGLVVLLLGYAQANLDKLDGYLTSEQLGLAGFCLGALIIINRFVTDKALKDK